MSKTTRRTFLQATSLAGVGYFVAAGNRTALSNSPNQKPNVVSIGVGGKGGEWVERRQRERVGRGGIDWIVRWRTARTTVFVD